MSFIVNLGHSIIHIIGVIIKKKTIALGKTKMHPLTIQRVHCIKIGVFSHISTPILIQSKLGCIIMPKCR